MQLMNMIKNQLMQVKLDQYLDLKNRVKVLIKFEEALHKVNKMQVENKMKIKS